MKKRELPPWSIPVAVHDVPETGRRFDLSADAQAREGIASAAGLRSVTRLEVALDVSRHGHDGLRVAGHISATVGQVCVVTLEPIENMVEEDVDLVFAPAVAPELDQEGSRPAKKAAEHAPEPLMGGTVDLGALATEFLILGLDPHPRKQGATFEAPTTPAGESGHPFAALVALKKGRADQ